MAIPTSNAVQGNVGNGVTTLTVAGYTRRTADNYALVRIAYRRNSAQDITGVTYGGVAMTQLGTNLDTAGMRIAVYGLANPLAGAQNVVASFSAVCVPAMAVATYDQVSSAGTPLTSTSATADISTAVAGAADTLYVGVAGIRSGNAATTTPTGAQVTDIELTTVTPICLAAGSLAAAGNIAWNEPNFFTGSGQIVVPLVGVAGTVPTISGIDGDDAVTVGQTSVPGTGSGLTGATFALVDAGGTTQSLTATVNSDTSFTIPTVPALTAVRYGSGPVLARATTGGGTGDRTIAVSPAAGTSYTDLISVDATAANRITGIPDLAAGDQLEVSSVVGGTISDVTIFPNGADFSTASGVTAFTVRRFRPGTGWGTTGVQTVGVPTFGSAGTRRRDARRRPKLNSRG